MVLYLNDLMISGLLLDYSNVISVMFRNDFQKMGKDLEFAKGRDMERYNKILQQLKESYRHCGAVCIMIP